MQALADLIPKIVEDGGFCTAAVAVLINREWRAAALDVLESSNPVADTQEATQGNLEESLDRLRRAESAPARRPNQRRRATPAGRACGPVAVAPALAQTG